MYLQVVDCSEGEDEAGCDWYKDSAVPTLHNQTEFMGARASPRQQRSQSNNNYNNNTNIAAITTPGLLPTPIIPSAPQPYIPGPAAATTGLPPNPYASSRS